MVAMYSQMDSTHPHHQNHWCVSQSCIVLKTQNPCMHTTHILFPCSLSFDANATSDWSPTADRTHKHHPQIFLNSTAFPTNRGLPHWSMVLLLTLLSSPKKCDKYPFVLCQADWQVNSTTRRHSDRVFSKKKKSWREECHGSRFHAKLLVDFWCALWAPFFLVMVLLFGQKNSHCVVLSARTRPVKLGPEYP